MRTRAPAVLLLHSWTPDPPAPELRCGGRGCRRPMSPGEPVHFVAYDDGARPDDRAALCDGCLARLGDRVRPARPPRPAPPPLPPGAEPQPQW